MGEIFNNEGGGLQMKIKQLKKYGMIISFLAVAALGAWNLFRGRARLFRGLKPGAAARAEFVARINALQKEPKIEPEKIVKKEVKKVKTTTQIAMAKKRRSRLVSIMMVIIK